MKENKLIAKFMGIESYPFRAHTMFIFEEDNHRTEIDLHYHDSWNWLMPVVEKCYNTKESYNLHKDIEDAFIDKFDDRLKAVYLSVVSFIKSYNEAMGQESVYSIRDNN